MSVVSSDGTCCFYSESTDTADKFASNRPCNPSSATASPSSRPSRSCTSKSGRRSVIQKRSTLSVKGTLGEGKHLMLKYHSDFLNALKNLFAVHLVPWSNFLDIGVLHPHNIVTKMSALQPSILQIFTFYKGQFHLTEKTWNSNLTPFPIRILIRHGKIFLVSAVETIQKCLYCSDFFKNSHTCNVRRREFYFHHVNFTTKHWWEPISFRPIGSIPTTKRLFVTYDIETYTWHGKYGKQLIPYLLVFHLSGDPDLIISAKKVALENNWNQWQNEDTFFVLTPEKREIGKRFKSFRSQLQKINTDFLWNDFLTKNPSIRQFQSEKKILTPEDVPFKVLQKLPLMGDPVFLEIYIIGHNISGFDEIVLAAQVIANKADIAPCFRISRNFMPRAGKILFNDITFELPNPLYQKRKTFPLWKNGSLHPSELPCQYVKFMVRDTLSLTHTSLRTAASAYSLNVEKGHCPYEAVNAFYRTGMYLQDEDGFPHVTYWKSEDEYNFNKELWRKKKMGAYDIIHHALCYCIQDVKVTAELVQKLQQSYNTFIQQEINLPEASFNIFQRPTISSNSHAIFKQVLYSAEKMTGNTLGDILLAPSNEMYDYVRESIRGGRCYPTFLGILSEPVYVYDICGMYASALTHPLPIGKPLNPLERAKAAFAWKTKLESKKQIDYFCSDLLPGIFTIDADPPEENFLDVLPPFCSRRGGRLCWTNEPLRGEVATSVDLITLHNRGWEVRIVPDERTTIFPQWKCIAREYVNLNISAKEKADTEKNQTLRSIAKLLSNALYGSFATKLDNKKIVFSDQIDADTAKQIANGNYVVKSSSFIETDDLSAEIIPEFVVAYPPVSSSEAQDNDKNTVSSSPYIASEPRNYLYKPITFLDFEEDDVCLHTLEKTTPTVENNRYPSQIASFVLAWTRAFISEWCEFLYLEDRGIPFEDRVLKSVYGDTDSLFLTEKGRQLMETKGKHRLKKNGGNLVFDPSNPAITWLVECETKCLKCGEDAFSPESVFLAPKLYALHSLKCNKCGFIGTGKLRAKGHPTNELSYELLKECFLSHYQQGTTTFQTARLSLKKTLANANRNEAPFTVTETTLKRTIRPWNDKTLRELTSQNLVPYSQSNPNPRNQNVCLMNLPWDA
ncbi:pol [Bottlenose dolphin adenovirus 1]|uniref:DNA polymerase n=1 Tax=Bottlenose dolphin adenovirus 1 TaxID=1714377 RepID=A0A1X7MNY1_9ADEN|nr:pol [Bottlenose dolphin adenovirus 1]SMG83440.1 pol [Bottlenose dolphin adenovirus 1]